MQIYNLTKSTHFFGIAVTYSRLSGQVSSGNFRISCYKNSYICKTSGTGKKWGESGSPKIKSYFVQPRSNWCTVQVAGDTSSLQYEVHHNKQKDLHQWELISDSEKHSPEIFKFPHENRSNY